MARDLRYIYALGFIALELERIGDYAVNIAEETIKICQDEYIKDLIDIPKMYEECKKMILEVKESLENENEDLAREIFYSFVCTRHVSTFSYYCSSIFN